MVSLLDTDTLPRTEVPGEGQTGFLPSRTSHTTRLCWNVNLFKLCCWAHGLARMVQPTLGQRECELCGSTSMRIDLSKHLCCFRGREPTGAEGH